MCIPHFVYPFIPWWTHGLLLPLAIVNNAVKSIGAQLALQDPALGLIPRVELLGHTVTLFLILLRNCHTVFHTGCTVLHSHQQCKKKFF